MINMQNSPLTHAQRAEQVTGKIIGVGIIFGGGALLYKALPYLITLLENTIYATFLGIAAVGMITLVLDKRFWQMGSYLYKTIMRRIAGLFVVLDPISILKIYIEEGRKKLQQIGAKIAELAGQIRALKTEIETNNQERDKALHISKQAKDKQMSSAFRVNATKAGLLQEANLSYEKTLKMAEGLYRVLVRLQEVTETYVDTLEVQVDVQSRKYEIIKKSWSTIRSVMSILKGSQSDRELFDMAMDHIIQDSDMKLGEIEDHMRVASSFVDAMDLQNGIFEGDAIKQFEEWEKRTDSLLLGAEKPLLLEGGSNPMFIRQEPVKVASGLDRYYNSDN